MSLEVAGPSRLVIVTDTHYDRCRDFYERVLGLPIDCEWDRRPEYLGRGHRGVVYSLGTTHIEILFGDAGAVSRGTYIYIPVRDVDSLFRRLETEARVIEAITSHHWGHRNFAVLDPAGTQLKFYTEIPETPIAI